MSNIIKNKDTLLLLKDIINNYDKTNLSKSYIEEILRELIPNKDGNLLIKYKVKDSGISIAKFVPEYESINININKVNEWLDKNTGSFLKEINTCDSNTLRNYLFLFMITHEIEHSYQYLMGKGIIESPNDVLKNAYNGLFDLMASKDYIIPRPIIQTRRIISRVLYKANENFYLLERNANIESMDTVSKVALFNDREDVFKLFLCMKNIYTRCGYTDSTIGSIEETYTKILMHDKYKKFYKKINIDEKEKVRYGFNISEDTRKKVLKLQ